MSERDKKLLVYLGALIILAIAYFLVVRPYLEKIDQLSSERIQLDVSLREKQEAYANQEEYKKGIESAHGEIQSIIDKFPEDNSDEKSIMFVHHAERAIPIWVNKIQFAEETQNFVNGDEVQNSSDTEGEINADNVDAVANENNSDNPEGAHEGPESAIKGLISRDTELGIEFASKYDEFKEFLAYIRDYEDRIVIKEVELTYDEAAGLVHGSMILSQYAILGEGRILPDVVTDVDKFGTDNVFVTKDKGNSILDIIADEISDLFNRIMGGLSNEAAEEFAADYFMRVNAVTDNTSGKTIGRTSDIQQSTYLISDSNSNENVSFVISGSDGTYKIKYSIGEKVYEDSIEKESGQTLYFRIVSTDRMADSDKVSISLHVTNNSDIPLVVAIEGDDDNNPRVDVVEQDGDITVK